MKRAMLRTWFLAAAVVGLFAICPRYVGAHEDQEFSEVAEVVEDVPSIGPATAEPQKRLAGTLTPLETGWKPDPTPAHPFLPFPGERLQKLLTELDQVTSLSIPADTPLTDALVTIQETHQIQVTLDTTALNEAGLDPESCAVSINVTDIMLREALPLMLHAHNLTYMLQGNVLVVTTPEVAEKKENLILRVYPVGDLASGQEGFSTFIDLIESSTGGDGAWEPLGGTGTVRYLLDKKALVIRQTFQVHKEIEILLESLRTVQHGLPLAAGEPAEAAPPSVDPAQGATTAAIPESSSSQ